MPWGFRGKEGHLEDDKKSRCSIITCLPCRVGHKKLFMVITYYWENPQFRFFKGEIKVSLEPAGSPLPAAQNNPHAKVPHLGESYEPLHNDN